MAFIALILFVVVLVSLTRRVEPPPTLMSEAELAQEGLTPLEIRRELRAQRAEQRAYKLAQNQAARTANSITRGVITGLSRQRRNRITGI